MIFERVGRRKEKEENRREKKTEKTDENSLFNRLIYLYKHSHLRYIPSFISVSLATRGAKSSALIPGI